MHGAVLVPRNESDMLVASSSQPVQQLVRHLAQVMARESGAVSKPELNAGDAGDGHRSAAETRGQGIEADTTHSQQLRIDADTLRGFCQQVGNVSSQG